jgi:uncharacterized RDD family membrane protein YckC
MGLIDCIGYAALAYLLFHLSSFLFFNAIYPVYLTYYAQSTLLPNLEPFKKPATASGSNEGPWALVTGASDGIGLAFAHVRADIC